MDREQVLAERRLWMERDGVAGRKEVALQIGRPQWSEGGGRRDPPHRDRRAR